MATTRISGAGVYKRDKDKGEILPLGEQRIYLRVFGLRLEQEECRDMLE